MTDNVLQESETDRAISDWIEIPFLKALAKQKAQVKKVKQRDFKESGYVPIIDQSQEYIAGYWDDENDAYQGELPVIVFGDHTRVVKYVDFPFVAGADGVKVIVPNKELFDTLYLYYQLLTVRLEDRGYNRHYSLLKEKMLIKPPLPEQRAIAHVLRTVQEAKEKTEAVIEGANYFRNSLIRHLFSSGYKRPDVEEQNPKLETELGTFPGEWEQIELGEVVTLQRGKDLPKKDRYGGDYPVVGSNGIVDWHQEYVSKGPGATVGRSGSVGKTAWIEKDFWPLNTVLWAKNFHGNDEHFVYYLLSHLRFENYATGVSVPTLNRNFIHPLKIAIPDISEQKKIAGLLKLVDAKIQSEQNRKEALEDLFQTLLHDLMTAKIRVKDLEVPADA